MGTVGLHGIEVLGKIRSMAEVLNQSIEPGNHVDWQTQFLAHLSHCGAAVFSTPGKFTACFAEAEERSPFEPFHVAQGFPADESVITVVGVEAPHSLVMEPTGDVRNDAERLIKTVAGVIANPGSNNVYRYGDGCVVVVLNPEHATLLAKAGFDRARICGHIQQRAFVTKEVADALYGGLNFVHPDDDEKIHAIRDPSQIMLIVAGGMGTYSMVLPSWAYAPSGNIAISETIDVFPHCDLPFD